MPDPSHGLTERQLVLLPDCLVPFADKIDKVGLFGSRAHVDAVMFPLWGKGLLAL